MNKGIIKNEKVEMPYTCESLVNDIEFERMVYCFRKMYWNYVLYGMILNLVFTALIIILLKTLIEAVIFFTVCQLFVMLIYKLRFRKIMRETLISHNKNKVIDVKFSNYFYEHFFVTNRKNSSHKINYNEINIFIKTEDNIYLCAENKKIIVILQKDKCSENLINFLDEKFYKKRLKQRFLIIL